MGGKGVKSHYACLMVKELVFYINQKLFHLKVM